MGLLLAPLALLVTYLGGIVFTAFMILILLIAAWEFVRLLKETERQVSSVLVLSGVLLLSASRAFAAFQFSFPVLTGLILAAAIYHLIRYEQGRETAFTDFSATLTGILYIGWMGSYFFSLRSTPNGMWWMFFVLPLVWLADTGAYLVGLQWGKTSFSPRLSPNKTWEGFGGGILTATLGGAALSFLFRDSLLILTPELGALFGFILAVIIPLGDLTESMLKRQAGRKDSGHLFPGHGGVFDRIDTLLWAIPLSYYLILNLFPNL